MTRLSMNQIAEAICNLGLDQRAHLLRLLRSVDSSMAAGIQIVSALTEIRDSRFAYGIYCVYCQSRHVRKYGKRAGRQRYQCKVCRRTFNDLSATPMHKTRYPEKWPAYLGYMTESYSIRKCAGLLEIDPSTAFEWRHKILHALAQIDGGKLGGIVEADETYELFSAKGRRKTDRDSRHRGGKAAKDGISSQQVCVVVARDRTGRTLAKAANLGRLNSRSLFRALDGRLAGEGVTFCTDGGTAYATFCRKSAIRHKKINLSAGRRVIDGIYHTQNVSAFQSRYRIWAARFHGTASKYLNNYWAWFAFIDRTHALAATARIRRLLLDSVIAPMKVDGHTIPAHYDQQFWALCA